MQAHVAQSVERFLGKEEVHRFDSGRGLHALHKSARSEAGETIARPNLRIIVKDYD